MSWQTLGSAGTGTGWAGEVDNFAALPAATGSGDVYLVKNSTGFLWNRRKGLYRDEGVGTWNRLSNATFQALDSESKFYDNDDNTKIMDFQLSGITAGNTRTLTCPDSSGTIALISDIYDPEKTYVVSPSGGDYTTIQAALTAHSTGGELFLVYPGTYTNDTINFTANNQCVVGVGTTIQQVVTNTTAICVSGGFTGCSIENINFQMTATTSQNMINGTGSLRLRFCKLEVNASGTIAGNVCAICHSGTLTMEQGQIIYNNAAISAGQVKSVVLAQAGATIKLEEVFIDADGSNASAAFATAYSTGTGVFDIERCTICITDTDSDIVVGLADVTGSGEEKFEYNFIEVTCGGAGKVAYGFLATSGTTLTSRLMFNHIDVSDGGGSSYGFSVGANVTVISHFDDITAADGNIETGTYTCVNSPSDGNLCLSGNIGSTGNRATKGWFTDIESTNIPTVGGASLNTGGTLNNVAYLDQANVFTGASNTFKGDNVYLYLTNSSDAIRGIMRLNSGVGQLALYDASGNLDVNIIGNGDSYIKGGNLAIGHASPAVPLDIFKSTDGNIAFFYGSNEDGFRTTIYTHDANEYGAVYVYDENDGGAAAYGKLRLGHAATDANSMLIDGNTGNIAIGTSGASYTVEGSSINAKLFLLRPDTAGKRGAVFSCNSNTGARSAQNSFLKASSAGGAVGASDNIGDFFFEGHDGTDYNRSAAFGAVADGSISANTVPMALYFSTSASNSGGLTERMRIDSSGNIGLGTSSPSSQLDVYSTTGGVLTLSRNDTTVGVNDVFGQIDFWNNDISSVAAGARCQIKGIAAGAASYGNMTFSIEPGTGLAEVMRIDYRKRLGVLTTSPQQAIHLEDTVTTATGVRMRIRNLSNNAATFSVLEFGNDATAQVGGFFLNSSNNTAYAGANSINLINITAAPIAIGTNNLVRLLIDSSGNIGIGTSAPLTITGTTSGGKVTHCSDTTTFSRLVVTGNGAAQLLLSDSAATVNKKTWGLASDNDDFLIYSFADNLTATERLKIDDNGNSIFTGCLKATTGDPTGVEGMLTINTNDNAIKIYADGAWRTLASW